MLRDVDPEIANLIESEKKRQDSWLELIPSESYPSAAAFEAQASVFWNKLVAGFPGKREIAYDPNVDMVENLAIERAKSLFGAEHANVQCVTASIANLAVYHAMLKPGDTVLAMEFMSGAHITHGDPKHISSRLYKFVRYGVNKETARIDFEEVRRLAKQHHPRMIITGASFYPRIIDFAAFREIADEVDAYFLVDMAHIAGLVAGKVHPNPVPFADVVTCSTHKTLRAPRGGGLILCKKEYADRINEAVHPGLQDAPLIGVIAARAVIFKEAMSPKFREYAKQVVANAKTLAERLMEDGFRLVTNGTDNHLMVIDLRNKNLNGPEAERILESVLIDTNRNPVPNDPSLLAPGHWLSSGSGLRIGTPAVTIRGMREPEMKEIASMISSVLNAPKDNSVIQKVKAKVEELVRKFPLFGEEIRIQTYRV